MAKRFSPLVFLPPVIFAALGLALYLGLGRDDQLPSARTGEVPPAMTVQPLPGLPMIEPAMLADGRPKLVNFFASWCAPCRVEHPNLTALAAQGIPIYGVNYKDAPDRALAFLAELGNPYTAVAADPTARTGLDWGVYGIPETFVLDGEGRVVFRFAGPLVERSIESDLMPALRKAGWVPPT